MTLSLFNRRKKPSTNSYGAYSSPVTDPTAVRGGLISKRTEKRNAKAKQPSRLQKLVNQWWNRLLEAVYDRSFSEQTELYAANQGMLDYVLNTVGQGAWGVLFPLLTIVATQLSGADNAGMFSMAFVTGTLLMYLGNYGVRTFQVSDLEETESFAAYQIHRAITCVAMLVAGWLYIKVRGYTGEMALMCDGVFVYRMVDALADVYEGRLQQMEKLYLAGVSTGLRSLAGLVVFTVMLFLTRSLVIASVAMAVVAVASLVLVTIPLALFETPKSRKPQLIEVQELFQECFPAFAGLILYALIDNAPKYAMEGALSYDNQTYFNAIYFGANGVLMAGGLIYKPQLVRLANIWSDPSKRPRFDLVVIGLIGTFVVVAGIVLLFTATIGIPLNGLLYATDFERFRMQSYLMVGAGALAASIDFLFQTLTVLRQQDLATRLYLVGLVVAFALSYSLVHMLGFDGAVYAYLISHVVLFGLFVAQYVVLRVKSR